MLLFFNFNASDRSPGAEGVRSLTSLGLVRGLARAGGSKRDGLGEL